MIFPSKRAFLAASLLGHKSAVAALDQMRYLSRLGGQKQKGADGARPIAWREANRVRARIFLAFLSILAASSLVPAAGAELETPQERISAEKLQQDADILTIGGAGSRRAVASVRREPVMQNATNLNTACQQNPPSRRSAKKAGARGMLIFAVISPRDRRATLFARARVDREIRLLFHSASPK